MARGLIKATAYYNNIEARLDWEFIERIANQNGLSNLAQKHKPAQTAGYRRVDTCIAKLREALREAGVDAPRRVEVEV